MPCSSSYKWISFIRRQFCSFVRRIRSTVCSFGIPVKFHSPRRRCISTRQNKSKLFESTHMVQKCWAKRWSSGGHLCMSMIWDIHPPKLKKISNVFHEPALSHQNPEHYMEYNIFRICHRLEIHAETYFTIIAFHTNEFHTGINTR